MYKQKWIEALRSGKYKQGKGHLHIRVDNEGVEWSSAEAPIMVAEDRYCCLGILALVSEGKFRDDGGNTALNDEVFNDAFLIRPSVVLGSGQTLQDLLASMNDDQNKSFTQIADWIEENVYEIDEEGGVAVK